MMPLPNSGLEAVDMETLENMCALKHHLRGISCLLATDYGFSMLFNQKYVHFQLKKSQLPLRIWLECTG